MLPDSLQPVAWALPSSHAFEGMRLLMREQVFDMGHFWRAVGLNLVFIMAGLGLYALSFLTARKRGLLLQMGE